MRSLNPGNQSSPLRVFVVCDQTATAPIWGYLIREKGLVAIMETSTQRAMDRAVEEKAPPFSSEPVLLIQKPNLFSEVNWNEYE